MSDEHLAGVRRRAQEWSQRGSWADPDARDLAPLDRAALLDHVDELAKQLEDAERRFAEVVARAREAEAGLNRPDLVACATKYVERMTLADSTPLVAGDAWTRTFPWLSDEYVSTIIRIRDGEVVAMAECGVIFTVDEAHFRSGHARRCPEHDMGQISDEYVDKLIGHEAARVES